MKKIVSIVMIFALLLSLSVIPAAAVETGQETRMAMQGEIIPKNVAEVLAEMFVQSNVDSGMETSWNTGTEALGTVTLYDEKGLPSAYSVELKTNGSPSGYVIISAYPDMENYILEYADTVAPLYDEFDPDETDQIVYTGNLQYYQETEDNILLDLQGDEVAAEDIINVFDEIRDEAAIEEARISAQKAFAESPPGISLFSSGGLDSNGAIINPTDYIEKYYPGSLENTAVDWRSLEQYTRHRTMSSFNRTYVGNCGPTAITNIVEITGNMRNISKIKNESISSIYATVEKIGLDSKWFNSGGTNNEGQYMQAVLKHYGVRVRFTEIYSATYEKVKNEIDKNRPFLFSINGYANGTTGHLVTAYAYTRFRNSQGHFKSFIKVADGWADSGRYIDMSTVCGTLGNPMVCTVEYY